MHSGKAWRRESRIAGDDGSSDNTQQEAQRQRDQSISKLTQKHALTREYKGPSHARDVDSKIACGKYTVLLDADGWHESCHLGRTTMSLEQHPNCSLVTANYFLVNGAGNRELEILPREILGRPGSGVIDDFFDIPKRDQTFPITCGAVFRRELALQFGAFDPPEAALPPAPYAAVQTLGKALKGQCRIVNGAILRKTTGSPSNARRLPWGTRISPECP